MHKDNPTLLLEARDLKVAYGGIQAVKGIALHIAPGELVALIGSNGAGKTTFVNMITGYLKPDEGQITLDGRDITPLDPRAITRLGVARSFQIPQLYGDLTVLDNMLVANACHDQRLSFWQPARRTSAIARADVLLERFRLSEHRERRVAELPGGVRKLLDIAMALAVKPAILLLDEPTSGVSADEKFSLMDLVLGAIRADKVTVLFVEHDMDIVRRYTQRILAFYDGKVIADGDSATVLGNPEVRRLVVGEPAPEEAAPC